MKKTVLLILLLTSWPCFGDHADKVDWQRKPIVCPLCKAGNMMSVIKSCGDYIYHWPSKYQYVFWPHTDDNFLYSCKSCGLTCYMTDFNPLLFPEQKKKQLIELLRGLVVPKYRKSYTEVPMSQRILIAEKVYREWGKDDSFWCEFYRVKGYHFAKEADEFAEEAEKAQKRADEFLHNNRNYFSSNPVLYVLSVVFRPFAKFRVANRAGAQIYLSQVARLEKLAAEYDEVAEEARSKALEIADEMMAEEGNANIAKELLYIKGAMRRYLGDDQKALENFREAMKLRYFHPRMANSSQQYDRYLNGLLREYIEMLEEEEDGK